MSENYNWNERYTYNIPTTVRFGAGVIDELAPHLKEQGFTCWIMEWRNHGESSKTLKDFN